MDSATAGLIGVGLGAFLHYAFSRHSEQQKRHQDLRTAAYVDFIRAVAGLAVYGRTGALAPIRAVEAAALLADAKARIAIYGSRGIAEHLAGFVGRHHQLETDEDAAAFIKIVQAMREETSPIETLSDRDIDLLLFQRPTNPG